MRGGNSETRAPAPGRCLCGRTPLAGHWGSIAGPLAPRRQLWPESCDLFPWFKYRQPSQSNRPSGHLGAGGEERVCKKTETGIYRALNCAGLSQALGVACAQLDREGG